MSIPVSSLGVLLILYGACLCVLSNVHVGIVAILLLGVLLLLYGIFHARLRAAGQKGFLKFAKIGILLLLIAELIFVGSLAAFGINDTAAYTEQAVIVLGSGIKGDQIPPSLRFRLDKAIEYAERNPNAVIVVSGGQGPQETVTEACAMEKYLTENGVPPERVLKEEQATSTRENLRYAKAILDEALDSPYEVVVITNGYHIYRAVSVAREEGLGAVAHLHGDLPWYLAPPCYLRESIAVWKLWLMG